MAAFEVIAVDVSLPIDSERHFPRWASDEFVGENACSPSETLRTFWDRDEMEMHAIHGAEVVNFGTELKLDAWYRLDEFAVEDADHENFRYMTYIVYVAR
jgi:hypothetical protein